MSGVYSLTERTDKNSDIDVTSHVTNTSIKDAVTITAVKLLPFPDKADVDSEYPSDSHFLANAPSREKGSAQIFNKEIKDLGWQGGDQPCFISGVPNDELWTLIRRFNKQIFHVKATTEPLPGNLDLNNADEEGFSPDKLRVNVERLYMTIIVGMFASLKHVARLRSWNERKRTGAFCAAYYVGWYLNILLPMVLCFSIVLVLSPAARAYFFPSAPFALVNTLTGHLQTPKAGMLGSVDSVTGAPEIHPGEALEREASNFVSGLAAIGLSCTLGKKPEDASKEATIPDPSSLAAGIADAKANAEGEGGEGGHSEDQRFVEDAMWSQVGVVMHMLASICDEWERFANAFSPTLPFPLTIARIRIAIILAILIVPASLSTQVVIKCFSFLFGLGLFGQPGMTRIVHALDERFPRWRKTVELRNTVLKDVPTNAQLTITLLRIGEANRAPIPPPPKVDDSNSAPPPQIVVCEQALASALDTTTTTLNAAIIPDEIGTDPISPANKKRRLGQFFIATVKSLARAGTSLMFKADHLKAHTGSEMSKERIGVLQKLVKSGPADFACRHLGKQGILSVNDQSIFFKYLPHGRDIVHVERSPISLPIDSIVEVKKIPGLAWKAKLMVGWAMDRNVADSLSVVDNEGDEFLFTAVPMRDELFNRLISIGRQRWECW